MIYSYTSIKKSIKKENVEVAPNSTGGVEKRKEIKK